MSSTEEVKITVKARLQGLLPTDWRGRAGLRFRRALAAISRFTKKHKLAPAELVDEGTVLARRKVHGVANKELAAAMKDFAQTEQLNIETQLRRRTLETQARRENIETQIAEIKLLDAQLDLRIKLQSHGVSLTMDDNGTLTLLPLPRGCDLTKIPEQKSLPTSETLGNLNESQESK
jgi:hypothetical protein